MLFNIEDNKNIPQEILDVINNNDLTIMDLDYKVFSPDVNGRNIVKCIYNTNGQFYLDIDICPNLDYDNFNIAIQPHVYETANKKIINPGKRRFDKIKLSTWKLFDKIKRETPLNIKRENQQYWVVFNGDLNGMDLLFKSIQKNMEMYNNEIDEIANKRA